MGISNNNINTIENMNVKNKSPKYTYIWNYRVMFKKFDLKVW